MKDMAANNYNNKDNNNANGQQVPPQPPMGGVGNVFGLGAHLSANTNIPVTGMHIFPITPNIETM